jgi:hypothetical protein
MRGAASNSRFLPVSSHDGLVIVALSIDKSAALLLSALLLCFAFRDQRG